MRGGRLGSGIVLKRRGLTPYDAQAPYVALLAPNAL